MGRAAILFDLDGTLLDTLADLGESMNEVLASFGHATHEIGAYKQFVGDGVANLVRRALPAAAAADPLAVDRCVREMRRIYGARWDAKTRPYPGVAEVLTALAERGVEMAVLSNKPNDLTQQVVARFLGAWRFAAVVGARPDVPRKPDPTAALQIAASMRREPANFLYVGDTDTDMRTADAAGMYALGALWGFREADELRQAGARALLATPGELLSHLD
jgi:phosphoglycolate phosphatase